MRVAVCDDEMAERMLLAGYLQEYGQKNKVPMEIFPFPDGESFSFFWEEDKNLDLLILDIEMGKLSGMELARRLRKTDEELPILFVTGYDEYLAQGYEVSALHYLIKPIHKEKFFEILNRLRKRSEPEAKVTFLSAEGILSVSVSRIWYAEAFGHQCVLHMEDREYTLKESIGEVEKKLSGKAEIVKCHRSYLVNLQHVAAVMRTELLMDNDNRIPVSRNMTGKVNDAFLNFYVKLH